MILVGNQRGGAKNLAAHLLKTENENVDIHELRGFIGQDLHSAFQESYAISRGTHCKQHLYSLSFNPPKDADVSKTDFETAINEAEERLGLSGQPRAIVFHEKYGDDGQLRRHAHAVWCRIKSDDMKAVQLSYTKNKLQELGRDLYIKHDWTMPRGFLDKSERDPLNFTLDEWQQTKRAGKDAKQVKSVFKDAWAVSDCQSSFAAALKEQGYILARGDRCGFVAVDYQGEKYAIAKYVGIKSKQVSDRLHDPETLPSTTEAHEQAAKLVTKRLEQLRKEQSARMNKARERLKAERKQTIKAQTIEKQRLQHAQKERMIAEDAKRQARLRKGLYGLWDRFTGKRKKAIIRNEFEAAQSTKRDLAQKAELEQTHDQTRRRIKAKSDSMDRQHSKIQNELTDDIQTIETKVVQEKELSKEALMKKRKASRDRPRRRSRSRGDPNHKKPSLDM